MWIIIVSLLKEHAKPAPTAPVPKPRRQRRSQPEPEPEPEPDDVEEVSDDEFAIAYVERDTPFDLPASPTVELFADEESQQELDPVEPQLQEPVSDDSEESSPVPVPRTSGRRRQLPSKYSDYIMQQSTAPSVSFSVVEVFEYLQSEEFHGLSDKNRKLVSEALRLAHGF
ncbi:hypothetical protein LOTGIDRAFT_175614 [Lottia gigantea]|uniref:Uncharacterized protein n=1 Tax=Lottia gigantea TaxID=225164 RepID=V4BVU0_LOTGI|nr:hypothetical protein LOTGIDRAFT_175614 [Lottia gigantea]ESO93159.1 hypothetical protein LOTGIDRAFT_175614 [Lottia gigantea]